MTAPKSRLHATHRGYQIRHRPWRKRHLWRAQVPNAEGRTLWCNVVSPETARALVDRALLLMRLERKG